MQKEGAPKTLAISLGRGDHWSLREPEHAGKSNGDRKIKGFGNIHRVPFIVWLNISLYIHRVKFYKCAKNSFLGENNCQGAASRTTPEFTHHWKYFEFTIARVRSP